MAHNNNTDFTSKMKSMSNLIDENVTRKGGKDNSKKKQLTQHNIFMIKNKLVNDITHAIQLVNIY